MQDEEPIGKTIIDGVVVHVAHARKREGLPDVGAAIRCGRNDCPSQFEHGFGLAGGGFGFYEYCAICEKIVSKTETADV